MPSSSTSKPTRAARTRRKSIAFDGDLMGIERRGKFCRKWRSHPLGARDHDHAAVAVGQHAALKHRTAGPQRRSQIEPADQPVVGDRQWQFSERRRCREAGSRQMRDQPVARRSGADRAAEVRPRPPDRRQRCRRPMPRRSRCHALARGHAPNNSATARSTRTVEPASSSGSRRSRCRRADGATRRRCSSVTSSASFEARKRTRRTDEREFAAQSVGAEPHAEPRRALARLVADRDLRQQLPRGHDATADRVVLCASSRR